MEKHEFVFQRRRKLAPQERSNPGQGCAVVREQIWDDKDGKRRIDSAALATIERVCRNQRRKNSKEAVARTKGKVPGRNGLHRRQLEAARAAQNQKFFNAPSPCENGIGTFEEDAVTNKWRGKTAKLRGIEFGEKVLFWRHPSANWQS